MKFSQNPKNPKNPKVLKLLYKYTIGIHFIRVDSYKTFEKLGFLGFLRIFRI